ncbi:MAG: bi-domain-containing oxidoreductase [Anaerolineaceae bacterium]|nr:bi-domain-containing oxidoreductase [Anaerolineaceae bacterium]
MRQIIQNMNSGETNVVNVPIPAIKPGYILIKTSASLVSAGTERMLVSFAEKNLIGKAQSRPDLLEQVIMKAKREGVLTTLNAAFNKLDQPVTLGYSSSGVVKQVGSGVKKFKPGDRVVCAGGGFAVHAEYALIPKNLAAKLPAEVDFESGAFATMGAVALNGVRLANPKVGEISAVIGMGLLGMLTSQILQASGCEVFGMDINSDRIAFAKKLGIRASLNNKVISKYRQLTYGRGFDHVFICADTESSDPVKIAGEIARDKAYVIAIGAVGLNIPRKPYYEKEITFKVARSYGPGRYDNSYEEGGQDYPIGFVRWTEGRNLETIVGLIASGKLDVSSLITHHFPIKQAQDAYTLIKNKNTHNFLGIIITYPDREDSSTVETKIFYSTNHKIHPGIQLNIGILGAGNYANSVFLPLIRKDPKVNLTGIISAKGLNAQHSARKYGFSFSGSNEDDVFTDKQIDLIAVLTQHADHANQVIKGLQSGKHIYCEKPLALSKAQLDQIKVELKKKSHPYLTVGFNRRFAPFSIKLKSFFDQRTQPLFANYRVNAGFIPSSHWLQDPQKGGGRLIGEGCHFIDYLIFLVGQIPETVQTHILPNNGIYSNDNFIITMIFPDGSIGTISYLANGNKSFGKEYLEVFCGGKIGIIDDFRKLKLYGDSIKKKKALLKQDKGHKNEWEAFISSILSNGPPPIPYNELINTAYVILACEQSLQTGQPIKIKDFMQAK